MPAIKFITVNFAIVFLVVNISAQGSETSTGALTESSWFLPALLAAGALAIGVLLKIKKLSATDDAPAESKATQKETQAAARPRTVDPLRSPLNQPAVTKPAAEPEKVQIPVSTQVIASAKRSIPHAQIIEFGSLPVNSFYDLKPIGGYNPLPSSDDPSLLDALDQLQDESQDDPEGRLLALRVVAAIKCAESVEVLGQTALYDLSSNIRTKAVNILTQFDHESVFEPLLLACADLTREVRAAAARGLVRLSFDRADAWARIVLSGDSALIHQAAHAAVEAGFAQRGIERLSHRDDRVAYEAFAMVYLLVAAGETQAIFDAIRNSPDPKVRLGLIHVLKVAQNPEVIDRLGDLIEDDSLPEVLTDRIREAAACLV